MASRGRSLGLAVAEAGLAVMRAAAFERFFELVHHRSQRPAVHHGACAGDAGAVRSLPALQASRTDVNETLKEGGARSGGGVAPAAAARS